MKVQLTRRVVLEAATRVADGAGGYSSAWVPLGTLWADVRAGSGREKFASGVTRSTVPHRIIVRGAPEGDAGRPKPDQRFREGARLFRIVAVSEYDPSGRYLICSTLEEVAG